MKDLHTLISEIKYVMEHKPKWSMRLGNFLARQLFKHYRSICTDMTAEGNKTRMRFRNGALVTFSDLGNDNIHIYFQR